MKRHSIFKGVCCAMILGSLMNAGALTYAQTAPPKKDSGKKTTVVKSVKAERKPARQPALNPKPIGKKKNLPNQR